jgi:hemerythrin-like metal-binding protein
VENPLNFFASPPMTPLSGKRRKEKTVGFMTWDERYSVGVKTIDEEHKVLFGILNELYDAMKKGQANSVAGHLLNKLADYTRRHFASEEARMAASGYAGLPEHHNKHRDLIQRVEEYIARFERGDIMLSVDLFNFLRDWLTTHIQRTDKEYGPWLVGHGVH